MTLLHKTEADRLKIEVYATRQAMGEAAAAAAAAKIRELLAGKPRIRMVFAAAPSQNEFLTALVREPGIDWSRVTAFHMDEYIGLDHAAPQLFSRFLRDRLFDIVKPGELHLIDGNRDSETECARYAALLEAGPIDVICLGIGENGHIAFNDPPVADFGDTAVIKPVELDEPCRIQQVNDGCFASFGEVPTHALTLTVPTMMSGAHLFCMVPGQTKSNAVRETVNGPVSTACPSTILRTHPDCTLYVDSDSYGLQ